MLTGVPIGFIFIAIVVCIIQLIACRLAEGIGKYIPIIVIASMVLFAIIFFGLFNFTSSLQYGLAIAMFVYFFVALIIGDAFAWVIHLIISATSD
ncbi:MAG: hypothetical protein R3Y32_01780 [Bacillota bacterium]